MLKKVSWKIIVAVIVLLIIIVVVVSCSAKKYDNYLNGFWMGDPAFLTKAGLTDMIFVVFPEDDGERKGYLLMSDTNNSIIANATFSITYSFGNLVSRSIKNLASIFKKSDVRDAEVSVCFDDKNILVFPEEMRMTISISDGSLLLKNERKIYGFLWKDAGASHASNTAFQKA